jgi:hypothetical protein
MSSLPPSPQPPPPQPPPSAPPPPAPPRPAPPPPPPPVEELKPAADEQSQAAVNRYGTLALGFGIAGLIIGLLAFVALFFAVRGRRVAEESDAEPTGMLKAGWWLAWIGLALLVATVAIAIVNAVSG